MDYALIENKNPGLTWEQAMAQRREKQKKGSAAFQSPARKPRGEQAAALIKGFADAVAKAALFLAFVYLAYHGYRFLTTSPRFAIAEATVRGNHTLSGNRLLEWIGPVAGKNIFLLDLRALAQRLNEHPWIRSVSVERVLPQTVNITVEERVPYARIQLDRAYVLDNFGVLLAQAGPEYDHLPLITGLGNAPAKPGENVVTAGIIRGLHTMHYFNRLNFFRGDPIDTLQLAGGHRVVFTTRNQGKKIFMDLSTLAESFQNFKIYLDTFPEEARDARHIDLSFKEKVVVKRGPQERKQPEPQKL